MGAGGILEEDGAPQMIPDTKVLMPWFFCLWPSLIPHPPLYPILHITTRALTTSLQTGGCFRVSLMSSTARSPGRSRPASPSPLVHCSADLLTPYPLISPTPPPPHPRSVVEYILY